jgi:tetratricopeptide (TPR) repeat protein
VAYYQLEHKNNPSAAINYCQLALDLASSAQNTKEQSGALEYLAWIKYAGGQHFAAQQYAHEAKRLAMVSADLYTETRALQMEAMCLTTLGDYPQGLSVCNRARKLLDLCGMSGGTLDHTIMNVQAEVHRFKTEYQEALKIHDQIGKITTMEQDSNFYAWNLLNIAEIEVSIPLQDGVRSKINTAKSIFGNVGELRSVQYCNVLEANLNLSERQMVNAKISLCSSLRACLGKHVDVVTYALETLGDSSRWDTEHDTTWTTVFLVFSLKLKQKLDIHKALQFMGDVFLMQQDERTAIALLTVALDGFTYMDVHCNRAECMLRLGDICKGHQNLLKAVDLWETARPLFVRSSQVKQVEAIDKRLAGISEDVKEQRRNNLACLAEVEAFFGTSEEGF